VRPPSAREAARLPDLVYDTTFRGEGALSLPERPSTSYSSVREVVQIVDDRILTFDPAEPDQARAFVERGFLPPGTKRYKDRRFMFDKVFRPDASQQEVYDWNFTPFAAETIGRIQHDSVRTWGKPSIWYYCTVPLAPCSRNLVSEKSLKKCENKPDKC